MKVGMIKKIYDELPYWVKRPFSKIIRSQITSNHLFLETYNMLKKADELSERELSMLQLKRLQEVLIHAYEQTKYYQKIFDKCRFDPYKISSVEEIQVLPLLTRDDIKEHFQELAANDIDDFYSVSTGGTSGGAVDIYMERDAIYREWGFIYHYWSKYGYDFKASRLATFRGVELGKAICKINPLNAEIRMNPFIMNKDNIDVYNRKISEYGADFIYGYPSSIYNYCLLTRNAGIDVAGRYKAVFPISENLYDFQKDVIENTLDCPIAMFYGHTERAVLGERYGENYKFNPLYGVLEVSAAGEPIVTGFINHKFPLIRYLLDDYVQEVPNENVDGHKPSHDSGKAYLPSIGTEFSVLGHKDSEVIYGKNGEYFVGVQALDFHGLLSTRFSGIQLAQVEPGELIIRCVESENISEADLQMLISKCRERLGNGFTYKIEKVDKLQLTPRGKYKLLAQSLKPKKEVQEK